ncbi:hypothetical protein K435DRAFT_74787 [Dendrothele bispora CBS 962.96]|uniref:Uncharacterized protein n=1 Tax=Dendrothele bispora (strain CBS 962.96) TaxID=1314807 RepID=A0A4S8KR43_DENBC|nr:hypothetical protein K435DRAFT_74787 [Dendrothele bispora CBS 962.96]
MDFSDPYNLNVSPLAGGTQANPPSAANGFHTSDARSTSSNLEFNPSPHNSCQNCSSHHCRNDDENFLQAMEEGRDDSRRRLEWIWYCIYKAAPEARWSDREQVWRSLVESDDIWSIWEDGDDLNLPPAPISWMPSWKQPKYDNWKSITPIISRKIDRHSKNRCTPKLSPSPIHKNTSIHMRLTIVLWKTLLAARRVKYPRNPSSVNCEIPSLIPKWWEMLPGLVKDNLIMDNRSWDHFRVEQNRRGHTCMEDLPKKKMWSTWNTVQTLIGTSVPLLDIPLDGKICLQCLEFQKQPFGRSEFVKPHVLALWGITRHILLKSSKPYGYSVSIWDSPHIFSHYTSYYEDLDLGKSLFNQATLHKVDEWLTDIWSIPDSEFNYMDLRTHVGKTLDNIPESLYLSLEGNKDDLKPHWTETGTAISKISCSEPTFGSEPDSIEPASWISAVILFILARIYGLGPLAAEKFPYYPMDSYYAMGDLLKEAPLLSNTPPSKKFHQALKRSGHTCWPEESCGPNSVTNLYFSAYSLLLGASDVPVVGCEERKQWTKCGACHTKCAFHDLSLVVDKELLGPLPSLSDKDKTGRVRRLLSKLNFIRYQDDYNEPPPLCHDDLITLTKKLSSLSNLFQYALDNGQDMGLFNEYDEIFLGFNSDNEYSEDKDKDEDEENPQASNIGNPEEEEVTQASSPSMPDPESSAQLPEPVSNHENDTLNFEHLEVSYFLSIVSLMNSPKLCRTQLNLFIQSLEIL